MNQTEGEVFQMTTETFKNTTTSITKISKKSLTERELNITIQTSWFNFSKYFRIIILYISSKINRGRKKY